MTLGEKKGAATVPPPPVDPVQPLIVRSWFTSLIPLTERHVTGGADLVVSVLEQELTVATNDVIKMPAAMRRIRTLSPAFKAATDVGGHSLPQGRIDDPRQ